MPIEFRCSKCGSLLRTGDDTVGRQAQCPTCGTLTPVPSAAGMAGPPPPLADLGAQGSGATDNPFGTPPTSTVADGSNPYQSPNTAGGFRNALGPMDSYAAARVSAPATALMVTAILGIAGQTIGLFANIVQLIVGANAAAHEELPLAFGVGINVSVGVVGLAVAVVVLLGALRMKRLENYSFAMTAAILSIVPCVSPCCILGLPFGIWALVVLNDEAVRAGFRD